MNPPAAHLRDAKPLYEEGRAFGQYLDDVSPIYRVLLGRRFVDVVGEAFTKAGHGLSYEHTIFAELGGAIVGMVSGHAVGRHRRSRGHPPKQGASRLGLRMRFLARLTSWQHGFLGPFEDGDFYVQGIAVDEGFRGRGIGAALIDAMEERARTSGSKRLVLNVSAGNVVARRLYERRGMTVESAWPSLPCIPPLVLRMAKRL